MPSRCCRLQDDEVGIDAGFGREDGMSEPQSFRLVGVLDVERSKGVAVPVDDLVLFVPDNHDDLFDAEAKQRLEAVRQNRFAIDFDEWLRQIGSLRPKPRSLASS